MEVRLSRINNKSVFLFAILFLLFSGGIFVICLLYSDGSLKAVDKSPYSSYFENQRCFSIKGNQNGPMITFKDGSNYSKR
ncbi:hypothetical protein SDC9_154209 [bioreactor metagenome]|uniref:Uncharacterized protein n=1 Tax=bioreactor metagenome TaxID=1076179 RepID=A0A645F0C6_9ZZZZ